MNDHNHCNFPGPVQWVQGRCSCFAGACRRPPATPQKAREQRRATQNKTKSAHPQTARSPRQIIVRCETS